MGVESLEVNIFSLNVNGMGDSIKGQPVLDKLKKNTKNNIGIVLLEEVHGTPSLDDKLKNNEDVKISFSYGISNSKGIAILFSKNLEYKNY